MNKNIYKSLSLFKDKNKNKLYHFIKKQTHQQVSEYDLSYENITQLFHSSFYKDYLSDMIIIFIVKNNELYILFPEGDTRKKKIIYIVKQILQKMYNKLNYIPDMFIPFYVSDTYFYYQENIPFFVESKPKNKKGILYPDNSYYYIQIDKKEYNYDDFLHILDKKKCINQKTKTPILFFSGANTGSDKHNIRMKLKQISQNNHHYKIFVGEKYFPIYHFCKYKYLLNLPGHQPWSYRLTKILAMRSLVIDVNILQKYSEKNINEQWIQCFVDFFKKNKDYIQIDYVWTERETSNENVYDIYNKINKIYNYYELHNKQYKKIVNSAVNKSKMIDMEVCNDTYIYNILYFNQKINEKNKNNIDKLYDYFLTHPKIMETKIQKYTFSKKNIEDIQPIEDIFTELEKKTLHEFSKSRQIIQLQNNENDPVKVTIPKHSSNVNISKNTYFKNYIYQYDYLTKKINEKTRDILYQISHPLWNYSDSIIFHSFTNDEIHKKIHINPNEKKIISIFEKMSDKKKYKNMIYIFDNNLISTDSIHYYNHKYISVIMSFLFIYKTLQTNGNLLIPSQLFFSKLIDIIYLGTLLFNEVYIVNKSNVLLKGFKNDIQYIDLLKNIIKNNYHFKIDNKKNEKEVIHYFQQQSEIDLYFKEKFIINNKYQLYLYYKYISYIKYLYYFEIEEDVKKKFYHDLTQIYKKINKTIHYKKDDKYIQTQISQIYQHNYHILLHLIQKYKLKQCLQLCGTTNLLSNIINDISNIHLISIQPKEKKTNQKLTKIMNPMMISKKVKKHDIMYVSPLHGYHTLYQNQKKFDFIFINDKYDYDFILFYFVYSDKLLNKNGFIIINNSHFNEVSQCVKHIELHFKNYKKIGFHSTITIFKKTN